MEKQKRELLAPAGNMECLIAAVRNGADAVYFGGGAFNARRGAANFTGDSLKEAIDFCRLRGVKTHITLNTLLNDREIADALRFAAKLRSLRADAVIVQDIGLAALIRRELPELAVHASTQMGIHSLGGLRYCEENGVERAVLAREVPLGEIRRMHESSPVELEFFCHGALCMSFSGSCLYSSMAGERSGNRGTCAQPCRKNASVTAKARAGENEFALSTNDIAMIDELDALSEAGICSFKIEGRMKQPEYVAAVTRIYRAALDGEKPGSARKTLFEIFNRGEFSTAHLYSDSVRTGGVGAARPPRETVAAAHESMRRDRQVNALSAALDITEGSPARLTLVSRGETAEAVGPVCQTPVKPVDPERAAAQLGKLGGTPFFAESISVSGGGYLPVSELNAMRRSAAEELSRRIIGEPLPEKPISDGDVRAFVRPAGPAEGKPLRYVRVRSVREASDSDGDVVGIDPVFPCEFDEKTPIGAEKPLVLILPNVIMTEGARKAYLRLAASGIFRGVEVNNISHCDIGEKLPMRIAGVGMNVMNSASATKLLSVGFTHFMPSPELTAKQTAPLAEAFGSRMIVNVYGRTPLMQLMHCPVAEYRGCRSCRGEAGFITDGDGRRFPLENVRFNAAGERPYCLVRMLNCAVTDVREPFRQSGMRVFAAAETPCSDEGGITRGHWSRPVD